MIYAGDTFYIAHLPGFMYIASSEAVVVSASASTIPQCAPNTLKVFKCKVPRFTAKVCLCFHLEPSQILVVWYFTLYFPNVWAGSCSWHIIFLYRIFSTDLKNINISLANIAHCGAVLGIDVGSAWCGTTETRRCSVAPILLLTRISAVIPSG